MSSKEYKDLLQDDRWKRKSLKIRNRDFHTCQKCGIKGVELHVHHTRYYKGKPPWDMQDEYLITLCHTCHNKEHEGKPISSFVYVNKQKQQKLDRKKKRKKDRDNKKQLNSPIHISVVEQKKVLSHLELKLKLEEHKKYLERIKTEPMEIIPIRKRTKDEIATSVHKLRRNLNNKFKK